MDNLALVANFTEDSLAFVADLMEDSLALACLTGDNLAFRANLMEDSLAYVADLTGDNLAFVADFMGDSLALAILALVDNPTLACLTGDNLVVVYNLALVDILEASNQEDTYLTLDTAVLEDNQLDGLDSYIPTRAYFSCSLYLAFCVPHAPFLRSLKKMS